MHAGEMRRPQHLTTLPLLLLFSLLRIDIIDVIVFRSDSTNPFYCVITSCYLERELAKEQMLRANIPSMTVPDLRATKY
jgi:hypothetical protein